MQNTSAGINSWLDSLSAAGNSAAEGIGGIFRSVTDGMRSTGSRPQVTHIYHGGPPGAPWATMIVATGAGLTGWYVVCWWRDWDFLGLSQKRTRAMISQLKDGAHVMGCKACSALQQTLHVASEPTSHWMGHLAS